jgi:hypothetical protein
VCPQDKRCSAALLGLFLFILINWNRVEILGLEDLVAIEAPNVVDPITPIKKLGSLVLTSLHSEITPILD